MRAAAEYQRRLATQLIEDGTYFVVEHEGMLGGWSRRATLYGSDMTVGRNPAMLDPARDAARVRAMYTDPGQARRGVGTLILALCEEAARGESFRRLELMATMAGEPLYRARGFVPIERVDHHQDGIVVPLIKMAKNL
jgi:GNAT superfamily N-acetyltransferase